jgi:hypothetical protein
MARRPGLKTIALDHLEGVLRRERAEQQDVYAPLSRMRLDVRNPLAPIGERYQVALAGEKSRSPALLTPTSLTQVCQIAGVPSVFHERAPAALGLKSLRAMLDIASESADRQFLFRMKTGKTATLRAVLPQSYVRFDDVDVLAELRAAAAGEELRAAVTTIDPDTLFVRVVRGARIELGTQMHSDPALAGIDIITSETGRRPLEVRQVLFRVACANGLTWVSDHQKKLKTRYTRMDRPTFQHVLRATLDGCFHHAGTMATRLAGTRRIHAKDPVEEIERIFERYRLGSAKGRIGRWVIGEVAKNVTLFGVQRFDIVQAFTAVARGLLPDDRLKIEDAMGAYMLHGAEGRPGRPEETMN